jgi:hypothetical protein
MVSYGEVVRCWKAELKNLTRSSAQQLKSQERRIPGPTAERERVGRGGKVGWTFHGIPRISALYSVTWKIPVQGRGDMWCKNGAISTTATGGLGGGGGL